jgi:hypothetical protein
MMHITGVPSSNLHSSSQELVAFEYPGADARHAKIDLDWTTRGLESWVNTGANRLSSQAEENQDANSETGK